MKKKSKAGAPTDLDRVTNYIYEMGIHMHTPRSGLWLLGSGEQSVAEHLFRVALIAYALCHFEPTADKNKVILMALVHDIGEGRVSDLNYVHQRYGRLIEKQAVQDIAMSVPFGKEIESLYLEEQERVTLEAKLVKDADQLEGSRPYVVRKKRVTPKLAVGPRLLSKDSRLILLSNWQKNSCRSILTPGGMTVMMVGSSTAIPRIKSGM